MKKNAEIKTIEHKGVKVTLGVNYDRGTAILLQDQGNGNYSKKEWVFAERGLEYMDGWLKILEAMAEAVKVAKKDLEADLAEKSTFTFKYSRSKPKVVENKIIKNHGKISK